MRRLGDVVAFDDDYFAYFAVPADKLTKIRSVLTVVGGAVGHDTGDVR